MKALKRCGIDAFQIDTGTYAEGVPTIFPEVQQAYLEAAADAQIKLESASNMDLCDYGMVHPQSSSQHAIAKEIIQKSLDAMAGMNIPILMLPSFFDGEIMDEDGYQNTAKNAQMGQRVRGGQEPCDLLGKRDDGGGQPPDDRVCRQT